MSLTVLRKLERQFVRGCLRRGRQNRPPTSINVEPTNVCNLSCVVCPHGAARKGIIPPIQRRKGFMSMDTYKTLLDGCGHHIKTMALYLHGEPFLHEQLHEMIALAREREISVNLFTNGLVSGIVEKMNNVLKARPASVCLSMDLISVDGCILYKGEDLYNQARENFSLISQCFEDSRQTKLVLRSIYSGETEQQLQEFLERYLSCNSLHSIQITHPFPWPGRREADVLSSRLARRHFNVCPQVWNALNVFWDGTVVPCSYDYEGACRVGNIYDTPIRDIVNSPELCRFRRLHIFRRTRQIQLCANCFLPRFSTHIIVVRKRQYLKMSASKRTELHKSIMALKFNPAEDFLT